MRIKKVVDMFRNYSVAVTGMKGSGKDLLFANVISRRKEQYSSNIDYTNDDRYINLHFPDLDTGNTYEDFIDGTIKPYVCPYPEGTDVYISDAQLLFPSQHQAELVKKYRYVPVYMSLSRHLCNGKVHYNSQNYSRVWDKLREHCDWYIFCRKTFYIPYINLVFMKVTFYDKAESCQARIKPCRVPRPRGIFPNPEATMQRDIYLDNFFNQHGEVKNRWIIFFNKSKYDTRHFKKLLEGGS